MRAQPAYWFPAKRYGWGWGLPCTWQGWLVLALFAAGLGIGALEMPPHRDALAFAAWTALLTVGLVACCWIKGEPPRWRWGER